MQENGNELFVCCFSQFPPITSNQQRTNYKQLFSSEYPEYLALKENIEKVSLQYQSECTALSQRLQSLDRNSEEARVCMSLVVLDCVKLCLYLNRKSRVRYEPDIMSYKRTDNSLMVRGDLKSFITS